MTGAQRHCLGKSLITRISTVSARELALLGFRLTVWSSDFVYPVPHPMGPASPTSPLPKALQLGLVKEAFRVALDRTGLEKKGYCGEWEGRNKLPMFVAQDQSRPQALNRLLRLCLTPILQSIAGSSSSGLLSWQRVRVGAGLDSKAQGSSDCFLLSVYH